MFRIHQDQIDAFEEASTAAFIERMVSHLARFFPGHAAALGDVGVRDSIRSGIARAAKYGIATPRETCKYLTLMVAFGSDFDYMDWATAVLRDPRIASPWRRMACLYEAGIQAAERRRS